MKKVLIIIAAIVVILVVVIAMQPSELRISRTATIDAPAAKVYGIINDHHNWRAWSPWEKLDTNAQSTFTGPTSGVGSAISWSGNDQVGAGTMTITESKPSELVKMRLDFERPMKATSNIEFALASKGKQTDVTWTMTGQKNFVQKAFGLFMNCDQMMNGYFDEGLANLNKLATTPEPKGKRK